MRMTTRDWLLLLFLSVLWGASYLFIAVAVREVPVLTIVTARVALAAVALWLLVVVLRRPVALPPPVLVAFLGMGVLNNVVPFTLIVWAQTQIPAGIASILNSTTPVFTILVAGALLADERITGGRALGVLLGLAGAVTVIGPDRLLALGSDVLAELAVVAACVSYALSSVWGRRFRALGVDPVTAAAGTLSASSLLLLPLAATLERPWTLPPPGWAALAAILALALLSTALAYVIFYRVLATAGTNVMLVTLLIPVSAILFGTLFLGERLHVLDFAGMALIGLGLTFVDGRLWRRARPEA
jgi:drug/metabolite transporter (DMT)-like permease